MAERNSGMVSPPILDENNLDSPFYTKSTEEKVGKILDIYQASKIYHQYEGSPLEKKVFSFCRKLHDEISSELRKRRSQMERFKKFLVSDHESSHSRGRRYLRRSSSPPVNRYRNNNQRGSREPRRMRDDYHDEHQFSYYGRRSNNDRNGNGNNRNYDRSDRRSESYDRNNGRAWNNRDRDSRDDRNRDGESRFYSKRN